jgi:hypothetical protein
MDAQRHREIIARVEATVTRTRKTVERSRRAITDAKEADEMSKALITQTHFFVLTIANGYTIASHVTRARTPGRVAVGRPAGEEPSRRG